LRQVIRLQLLSVAFGLSGVPLPQDYSAAYEVDALGKALDALGIEQADFAGWSYGAEITLSYAIHNPARVRSLTLIEPPAMWVLRSRGPLSSKLLQEQKDNQALAVDDVSEEQLIWFTRFAGFVPPDVDPRVLPSWQVWYQHRQSLRMGDAPFRHNDSIEAVRVFQKPVLLLKGEGSKSYYHEIIDILAEEFPNARVKMLPGWHAPHIVSMQPFLEMFRHFLAQGRRA
jgi:pimeloyl-ACP methyl ester carboxylesterase